VIPAETVPEPFAVATAELAAFGWSRLTDVSPLKPPPRLAPYATAVIAELLVAGAVQCSGKLILLYDPARPSAWDGDFRCVTYATADIDPETVDDQLRAEAGWSWLLDALASHGADWLADSGTVTVSTSTHFGGLADQPATAEIELRASWTPSLPGGAGLTAHLAAWQDLLRLAAGLPPEAAGVIPLTRAARR
jgi:hypothetical protein